MSLIEAYIEFAKKIHMITGKSEPFVVAVHSDHYCRLMDEAMADRRTRDGFKYLMSEFRIQTPTNEIIVQPLNVPESHKELGL